MNNDAWLFDWRFAKYYNTKRKKNVGAFLCLVSKHRSKKFIATLSLNISIFISCKRRMMNEVVGTKKNVCGAAS